MLFNHSLTIYAESLENDVVSQNKKRLNAFLYFHKEAFL